MLFRSVGEGVGGDLGVWMSSGELREDWGSIAGGSIAGG